MLRVKTRKEGATVGAAATAGVTGRIPGILEVLESDMPKHDKTARLTVTAGSTTGTIGLQQLQVRV